MVQIEFEVRCACRSCKELKYEYCLRDGILFVEPCENEYCILERTKNQLKQERNRVCRWHQLRGGWMSECGAIQTLKFGRCCHDCGGIVELIDDDNE